MEISEIESWIGCHGSESKGEGERGRREARGASEIGPNPNIFGGVCGRSGDWSDHKLSH